MVIHRYNGLNGKKQTTLKNIQQNFFRTQIILIISLAVFLGGAGILINLNFETQKREPAECCRDDCALANLDRETGGFGNSGRRAGRFSGFRRRAGKVGNVNGIFGLTERFLGGYRRHFGSGERQCPALSFQP